MLDKTVKHILESENGWELDKSKVEAQLKRLVNSEQGHGAIRVTVSKRRVKRIEYTDTHE